MPAMGMPQVFNWNHIHLEFTGHGTVSGWASDDDVVMFDPVEIFEDEWGRDGALYGLANAKRGTVCNIKLAPSSDSIGMFQQMLIDFNDNNLEPFNGLYKDTDKNYGAVLTGCLPYEIPPVQGPGMTYEPKIICETVLPVTRA